MPGEIRVLQVFGSLNVGGAEARMMDVYRQIDKHKVQFDFISLDDSPNQFFENEIITLGGSIYKVPSPRKIGIRKHWNLLERVMIGKDYVAVHAHTSYHIGIILMTAHRAGIPVRISHARTSSSKNNRLKDKIYASIGRHLIKRYATHLLAVSNEAAVFLYKSLKDKRVLILPNAICVERYLSEKDLRLVEELSVSDDRINLIQVGRFELMKNHDFSLNVTKKLIEQGIAVHLYLVGVGPEESAMKMKVDIYQLTDYVSFLGFRNDVNKILKCMDIMLLPSLFEGLPGVVLEAQASGIHSYVSDRITKQCDLELGKITFLPLENIEKWVEKISNYNYIHINNSQIKNCFIKRGYDVSNLSEQLQELYLSVGL